LYLSLLDSDKLSSPHQIFVTVKFDGVYSLEFSSKMPFVHTRDMIILNGAALLVACYLGTSPESGIAPFALIALSMYITIVYTIVSVNEFEDKLNEHIDATTVNQDDDDDITDDEVPEEEVPEDDEEVPEDDEDVPDDEEAPEDEDAELPQDDDTLSDSPQNGLHPHTEVEDEHYCAEETCCKQITSNSGAGKCARCNLVYYCDQECQKKDWKAGHKLVCQSKEEVLDEDIPVVEPTTSPNVEPLPEVTAVEPVVAQVSELPVTDVPVVEPPVTDVPVVEPPVTASELVDLTAPDPIPTPITELPAPIEKKLKTTIPPPPPPRPYLPPPPPFSI
jgi:hypothetical protein